MTDPSLFRPMGRLAALGALVAALAACATGVHQAKLPPVTGDPAAHQQQRVAALSSTVDWALTGRVALSNGRDGGSGRLDWRQRGERYEVALSAPITRQSWRLSGAPGQALLEGLEGGPRQGADARRLLLDATRWDIPVRALSSWVRGMPADETVFGGAGASFGDDGRISRITQDGWTIDYAAWQAVAGQPAELPYRLTATRGEARVRLVVDSWQAD